MASAIDPSLPKDGAPASKEDLRRNLRAAKAEIEALQNAEMVFQGGGTDGRVNVKAHGAKGNGADDTVAFRKAIDRCPDGGVVYIGPGRYVVSQLDVPYNRSIKFEGASPWATTIQGKNAGEDIFRVADPRGKTVQNRFRTVHWYDNLGFLVNTGKDGDDLTRKLNRCTAGGLPVGPCAIAYVTDYVPKSATPSINESWLHSFGLVTRCVANPTRKHGSHGCGLIYHGGNHYGWTYQNIWSEGIHYGVTDCLPWNRRVVVDGTRFRVANGGNPYKNGQTLYVAAHAPFGKMPDGIQRGRAYVVRDADARGFNLADKAGGPARNLRTASGAVYVYGALRFASEYAPDGISLDRLTFYGGRCPVSLANCENLHIGRVDSYGCIAPLHLHGLKSANRGEHIGVVIDAFYSESPQSGIMPKGEDAVHINSVGGNVQYIQFRGATRQKVRPVARLKGLGYQIQCLECRSSASQAQPHVQIDGNGIGVYGLVHGGTTFKDAGEDNHYLLKNMSGGGFKFRKSPF